MLENVLDSETIFWFCALSGSGLFLIQLMLGLLGITFLDETDDLEANNWLWLSRHTFTGFLLFFGWTAILCQSELGLTLLSTVVLAILAGIAAVVAIQLLYRSAKNLESAGTVFDIERVLGREAVVYQRIPKGGIGKILVRYHDITYEINAIALEEKEITSFSRVLILNKKDDNTAIVEGFLC